MGPPENDHLHIYSVKYTSYGTVKVNAVLKLKILYFFKPHLVKLVTHVGKPANDQTKRPHALVLSKLLLQAITGRTTPLWRRHHPWRLVGRFLEIAHERVDGRRRFRRGLDQRRLDRVFAHALLPQKTDLVLELVISHGRVVQECRCFRHLLNEKRSTSSKTLRIKKKRESVIFERKSWSKCTVESSNFWSSSLWHRSSLTGVGAASSNAIVVWCPVYRITKNWFLFMKTEKKGLT